MGNCLTTASEDRASRLPKSRFSGYIETQKKLRQMKYSDDSEDSIYSRHRSLILSRIHKDSPKDDSTLNQKQMRKVMDEIFDKYDKDKDGKLNIKELHSMMESICLRKYGYQGAFDEQQIKTVMSKTDTSGDISLDKDEFFDFYKQF